MKESLSHAGTSPRNGLYPSIEPFRQQIMEIAPLVLGAPPKERFS